jgi:hypothetical protein
VDDHRGYGPQGELEKKMLIMELKGLKQSSMDRWVIMGDFNLIYKDEDKNNSGLNRRLMLRFIHALNHLALKEIHLTRRKYTWSSGQASLTLTCIDRAFCTFFERNPLQTPPCRPYHLRSLIIAPFFYLH